MAEQVLSKPPLIMRNSLILNTFSFLGCAFGLGCRSRLELLKGGEGVRGARRGRNHDHIHTNEIFTKWHSL